MMHHKFVTNHPQTSQKVFTDFPEAEK